MASLERAVGILITGGPPVDLDIAAPSYPEMVRKALGTGYRYREFAVADGELPDSQDHMGAYVVTGSASGVYDADPWIRRLRDWLQHLDPAMPIVGICFGHQIIAEAYGGRVERSARGWAGGIQTYALNPVSGDTGEPRHFALPVAHQDQVVKVPTGAHVLAANEFCPIAALEYRNRCALSFQGHPEFPVDYVAALIRYQRRTGVIDDGEVRRANCSLKQPDDKARVLDWIRRFIEGRRYV